MFRVWLLVLAKLFTMFTELDRAPAEVPVKVTLLAAPLPPAVALQLEPVVSTPVPDNWLFTPLPWMAPRSVTLAPEASRIV